MYQQGTHKKPINGRWPVPKRNGQTYLGMLVYYRGNVVGALYPGEHGGIEAWSVDHPAEISVDSYQITVDANNKGEYQRYADAHEAVLLDGMYPHKPVGTTEIIERALEAQGRR